MGTTQPVPQAAILQLPQWLWGGDPSRFVDEASLRTRRNKSGAWTVQTSERYTRSAPALVVGDHVVGPGPGTARVDLVQRAAATDLEPDTDSDVTAGVAREAARAQKSGRAVEACYYWQLLTMTSPSPDLGRVVEHVHQELLSITFEDSDSDPVFPLAGVYLIRRAPEILQRLSLMSVMLRISYDRRLDAGDITHIREANATGSLIFESSSELRGGAILFDAYLGPLMGALTPSIWALSAHRTFGAVVYTLGQAIAGASGGASEFLQIIPNQASDVTIDVPALSRNASGAAVGWWATRLNQLFGVLTDPAVFTGKSGEYVPTKHLHALLSIEQLFRRVTSIQLAHRDANARRVLLFSVLDTLERLTGHTILDFCSIKFARKTLDHLTDRIPTDAAEVLLPAAVRAVRALEETQDGFFLARTHQEEVRFEHPDGSVEVLSADAATAGYVKMLRNATHGHGGRPADQRRVDALLANHNGAIPHDLGLLGYLYLLKVLVNTERLQQHLYRGGRT